MPVDQTSVALSFTAPCRPLKPRSKGLTSIIDFGPDTFGWTGPQGVADYLSCVADYIDYAKIYAMNALLLPEAAVTKIIGLYRDANVIPYAGGILFEYAYQKNEIDGYIRHLKKIGMPQLEISENYITLTPEERVKYLDLMSASGFSVIYEFGRKNPTEPFSLGHLEEIVLSNVDMGINHTIIEQSEIDFVSANDPGILTDLLKRPWFANLFIEADPYAFPGGHVESIEKFGVDVNLANVAPAQALRLQGFRYGIGRAVNYSILSKD